jgi:cobalt-zinc-cadmium efflux system protein
MHNHSANSETSNQRIGWVFVLNVSFTIIEFIGGMLTNSTAIMADAVHDLGDSLAIGSAWF